MIRTIVIGSAGRMGRRLVANIMASETLTLAGATEFVESPLLGEDAGLVAGCGPAGVKITANLEELVKNADAVINFATAGVVESTKLAVANGCAVVIGTTALSQAEKGQLAELADNGGRIVSSYNMSVGVNLLFKLVGEAARTLGLDYDCEVIEMHHNQKKDAPSGSAVRLAEVVCEARGWNYGTDVRHGREGLVGARTRHEIGMHSLRGGTVAGVHTVSFFGTDEEVSLTHRATSRQIFVNGALAAAKRLLAREAGFYTFDDIMFA